MFITQEELKTVAYQYQLDEIVENDDTIIETAIDAAIEQIKSYLAGKYDIEKIFTETGTDRNTLIVELCKDIALWQIIRLANVDILFDRVKDRYDRAIDWLNKVADGKLMPSLPAASDGTTGEEINPMKFGSMERQNYDY